MGWRGLCICSQGCTKACIGAITLDSLLRSPGLKEATTIPDKFGSNFFKLHADKISGAWYGLFLFFFHPCTESSILLCGCREGTKPTGTAFNIFWSHLWPRYCAPNTDYQWSTTRPVKGEALSDERFAGEFASTIMQLARTVSLPNFWSFLDITASLIHVLLYEIKDKSVDSALWHVRCFLAPPTTLMRPSVLWKAALFKVKEALGSAAGR